MGLLKEEYELYGDPELEYELEELLLLYEPNMAAVLCG